MKHVKRVTGILCLQKDLFICSSITVYPLSHIKGGKVDEANDRFFENEGKQ
jgi:hypothetical protein